MNTPPGSDSEDEKVFRIVMYNRFLCKQCDLDLFYGCFCEKDGKVMDVDILDFPPLEYIEPFIEQGQGCKVQPIKVKRINFHIGVGALQLIKAIGGTSVCCNVIRSFLYIFFGDTHIRVSNSISACDLASIMDITDISPTRICVFYKDSLVNVSKRSVKY